MSLKAALIKVKNNQNISLIQKIDEFLTSSYDEQMQAVFFQHAAALMQDVADDKLRRFKRTAVTRSFRPSETGNCKRATAFRLLDAPVVTVYAPTDTGKGVRIFDNGDFFHVRMQALFQTMNIADEIEYRIDSPFEKGFPSISGYVDAIVTLPPKLVVELKTIKDGSYAFSTVKVKPKPEHIAQANLYMHFTKIPKALLLYENKNNQELCEHVLNFDKKIVDNVFAGFKKIWSCVQQLQLPDKEGESPTSFPCSFCGYARVCYDTRMLSKFLEQKKNEIKLSKKKSR